MKLVKMLGSIALAATACWTSPAPSPAAPGAQQASADEPRKITVRDRVQPVKIEKQPAPIESGDDNGVEGGIEGGVVGGDVSGVVAAPPPPPPPPPPQIVAPAALDANRIAGNKFIVPDPDTKTAIAASGKDRLVGTYKLCITAGGDISSVGQLKSTGFPAYDGKIQDTIRSGWRYRPFVVNGQPTAVCTAVTFIYTQALPPPPPPPPQP